MLIPIEARKAVQDYRKQAMFPQYGITETVLQRLEADPEGMISAALNRLKPASSVLVIFYLIQAVDLAKDRENIKGGCENLAAEFRKFAGTVRDLTAFGSARAPIEFWMNLPKLAEFFDQQAAHYETAPGKLHINREGSKELLALRHFVSRLRSEFRIKTNIRKRPQAIKWLVDVALECSISKDQLSDGLRRPRNGNSNQPRSRKFPKSPKRLNSIANSIAHHRNVAISRSR
jgi:hypothetical protein